MPSTKAVPNLPQSAIEAPGVVPQRAGLPITIEVGKQLPRHPAFARYCKKWQFLERSYKGGARYKDALDPAGDPVLVPHEQESEQAFLRRKRMAAYHNFSKPITDKLVGFVFSRPIIRDPDQSFAQWAKDVDGRGQSLHEYMRRVCLKAAVLDRWYFQIDTNKPSDGLTQAQVKAAGSKVIISDIHPTRVINWRKDASGEDGEDDLGEQYLILDDSIGEFGGARLWDDADYQVIRLDKTGLVESMDVPIPHEWPRMPIIKVKAHVSHQALIEDVAMLSLQVYNLDSWCMEELAKNTFSQWWAAGTGLTPDSLASVNVGSRKVIVLNMDAGSVKFERLASDPSQAQSIRETIASKVVELYRTVGLRDPTVQAAGPESGIALKIRFTDIAYKATELADMTQQAETALTACYSSVAGHELAPPEYPEDFNEDDLAVELKQTLDTVAGDLPMGIKRAQVRLYAEKAFEGSVDAVEMKDIQQEIEALYATPDVVVSQDEAAKVADAAKADALASSVAVAPAKIGADLAPKKVGGGWQT